MAKYTHAYVIPKQGDLAGGILYDRWDNFSWFVDVSELEDIASLAVDRTSTVKSHSRARFMNSKGRISVPQHTRNFTSGITGTRGALPGHTITLQATSDLGAVEKRDFTYDGGMSGLVKFLKAKASKDLDLWGMGGSVYDPIPKAGGGE